MDKVCIYGMKGCDIKTDIGGRAEHSIWGSNMKTGKFLHRGQFPFHVLDLKIITLCGICQLDFFSKMVIRIMGHLLLCIL